MKTLLILGLSLTFVAARVAFACSTAGTGERSQAVLKFSARKPAQVATKFPDSFEGQLGNLLLDHPNAVISVASKIETSALHPFGDGQSNARMAQKLLAVAIQENGKRSYTFDPSLKVASYTETMLGTWIKVQPNGRQDSFYFSFETATLPIAKLINDIPESARTFSGGRVAPDIAKVAARTGANRFTNLGDGFNTDAWPADSVHGLFNGTKTAVGGVNTWGNLGPPFKFLYTCFEPRSIENEKASGVPSGAGWHLIGDPAETVFNDLESIALPVAIARTVSFSDVAFGTTETITASWLKSGDAFVTKRGDFHWYLNPYDTSVCTEIWVHPCVPAVSNAWGLKCGA